MFSTLVTCTAPAATSPKPTNNAVNRDQVTDLIQRGVKQSTIDCYFFFAPHAHYGKRSPVLPAFVMLHSTVPTSPVNRGARVKKPAAGQSVYSVASTHDGGHFTIDPNGANGGQGRAGRSADGSRWGKTGRRSRPEFTWCIVPRVAPQSEFRPHRATASKLPPNHPPTWGQHGCK